MTMEDVKIVIGRAIVEAGYRQLLFDEPDVALASYDLTEEERGALSVLQEDVFDALAAEIEERVSKSLSISLPLEQVGKIDSFTRTVEAEVQSLDVRELLGLFPSRN